MTFEIMLYDLTYSTSWLLMKQTNRPIEYKMLVLAGNQIQT